MINPRIHGTPPFAVAVVHGGPGARGDMAPVARRLSRCRGVLEPLQTAATLPGQIRELASILKRVSLPPATLIGHSWGAWLCIMVAAQHPEMVRKLVLVGCAPLRTEGAQGIMAERLARMDDHDTTRLQALVASLDDPDARGKDATMAELGALMSRADSYDALPADDGDDTACSWAVFDGAWREGERFRREGGLLEAARRVRCPVLAVHGDHDPHPHAGVAGPLSNVLDDFRLELLPRCGHTPWRERHAAEAFFRILELEIP